MARTLFRQLIIGLLIGMFVIAGFYFFTKPYDYQGSLIEPSLPIADFSLIQADGSIFRLTDQQDKITLLYFGYTNCPDVCPTTLFDLAKVKIKMGDSASKIQVVMITVDPERDTLDYLDEYVKNFDPQFIGLSGDLEELEVVWSIFGVYRYENEHDSETVPIVDHTSRVYVIDTTGELRMTFPFGMNVEAISDDLTHLLVDG